MNKSQQRALAGIAVILAWLAALAVGLNTHDYEGLQLVTPVMLVYAGYLFGDAYFKKRENGES